MSTDRVNRAHFVEMNLLDVGVMDSGFGSPERLKYLDRPVLRTLGDGRTADDLANFGQSAMGVIMAVPVALIMVVFVAVIMRVLVRMLMGVLVSMLMRMGVLRLLRPELLSRQLFFARGNHIHLGRADAAAVHTRNLEVGIHSQRLNRADEQLRRHAGIDQRAEKHVSTDA